MAFFPLSWFRRDPVFSTNVKSKTTLTVSFLLFLRFPMNGDWFQVEHVISTLLSVGCSDNILLNAFASARLMQLGLPFRLEDVPIVNWDKFPLDAVK